jgi:hypothetical protein
MSPEIQIYLQNIKKFFSSNEQARHYFLNGLNDELFFNELEVISVDNFNTTGNPTLTKEQFEEIKVKLNKPVKEDDKLFFDFKDFGFISLN